MTGGDIVTRESEGLQPEICQVSLEAARQIASPILEAIRSRTSVIYSVASNRMAGMPIEESLNIAPFLSTDPAGSGVVVERYRQQAGALPDDADSSPEKLATLWESRVTNIPKLTVPEDEGQRVMDLASRMQMFGGGPVIFETGEVESMPNIPNTLLRVSGGARNAMRARLQNALIYTESHGNLGQPIVATAEVGRILQRMEKDAVAEFAPEAQNELELLIDSAITLGFKGSDDNRYGVRVLEDGSLYTRMQHPSGANLLVIAPKTYTRDDGNAQSGTFNAYKALTASPWLIREGFDLSASDIVDITGSHYGAMSTMSNLEALHDLRLSLNSFRVFGDNQPESFRGPQAHLIEIGKVTDFLSRVRSNPNLAQALFGQNETS